MRARSLFAAATAVRRCLQLAEARRRRQRPNDAELGGSWQRCSMQRRRVGERRWPKAACARLAARRSRFWSRVARLAVLMPRSPGSLSPGRRRGRALPARAPFEQLAHRAGQLEQIGSVITESELHVGRPNRSASPLGGISSSAPRWSSSGRMLDQGFRADCPRRYHRPASWRACRGRTARGRSGLVHRLVIVSPERTMRASTRTPGPRTLAAHASSAGSTLARTCVSSVGQPARRGRIGEHQQPVHDGGARARCTHDIDIGRLGHRRARASSTLAPARGGLPWTS